MSTHLCDILDEAFTNPESPTFKSLAQDFTAGIERHHNLSYADRVASSRDAAERVSQYVGKTKAGKCIPLFGKNEKMWKAEGGGKAKSPLILPNGMGVETVGLFLAPALQIGKFNTCPNHQACVSTCLGKTSGNYFKLGGGSDLSAFKGPRLNGLNKTMAAVYEPEAFGIRLSDELHVAKILAHRDGNILAARLNGIQDFPEQVWKPIIDAHPDIQFYDYSKNNSPAQSPNYHITRSSSGWTQHAGLNGVKETVVNPHGELDRDRRWLASGRNVAVVFSHPRIIPKEVRDHKTGLTYKVVDGTTHDFRPIDQQPEGQPGVIIGLKSLKVSGAKDRAHIDSNGFICHYDPQERKTKKGTLEKDENGDSIPTVHHVDIGKDA